MSTGAPVIVHFKEVENDEIVREVVEKGCSQLAEEFREIKRFEVTVNGDGGVGFEVHGHATGKDTDVATLACAEQARTAADQMLHKIQRQLRKHHDKRIFAQRRDARRDPPKRKAAP